MKKLKFSINIKASKEKIWSVLWDDKSYRVWTSVFSQGSYVQTDWKEGSKVLFLTPKGDGMYSEIVTNRPNEFMAFKHIGEVKNSKEQPIDEKTSTWTGSLENYLLQNEGEFTKLIVELDAFADFQDYFNETFPKALEKVKELSEKP
ncbi:MAG: SRPBCC domain-containing protein [Bacteroidetes bacterium]|nr:SRPBCC domain-containing protein [Bacteroidota bacterium]HET6245401.1 SRPBCC domain-containing protein [Bacteroidia bacterium]